MIRKHRRVLPPNSLSPLNIHCAVLALLLVFVFSSYTAQASPNKRATLAKANTSFSQGNYADARKHAHALAEDPEDFDGRLLLAHLEHRQGNPQRAELWVKRALAKATTDAQRTRGLTLRGVIERDTGRYDSAKRTWNRVLNEFRKEDTIPAQSLYGSLLMDLGEKTKGRALLDAFADDYNAGKMRSARDLTFVGRAVWKLEYYEDANEVFDEATRKDPSYIDAYIYWGDLFLEKYNTQEAKESYEEALKINPKHTDALLGLASVHIETDTHTTRARDLIAQAIAIHPNHPRAHMLRARIDIDDEDYDGALKHLKRALAVNPNHLQALELVAACHWLKDDLKAFRKAERAVLEIHPARASLYTTVARFGVRIHRYEEAIELNIQALRLDPDYWPAFVELGIGYTRIGDDVKGLQYLRKAHDNDPFHVRAFYMVNLYEKDLSKYTFVRKGAIRYRFHKKERRLLERLVPPLMDEAYSTLQRRYSFTPKNPVNIEIFRDPGTFAIRSVGLPHISPHGICFGRVVTARSPSSRDFNWAEVLWHELAHVFHIQLSKSRVPRWFTEGLAEYEASVARPQWRREQELNLVDLLRRGTLLSVRDLNKGFTKADSLQSIVVAYFQSTLVIEFIAYTWGFESLVDALKLYASSKRTPEVLHAITGLHVDAFDRAFIAFLEKRYQHLLKTFEPSLSRYTQLKPFADAAKKEPKNATRIAEHAAALFMARRIDQAETTWNAALKIDPNQPLARFLAAMYALRTRAFERSEPHLQNLLKNKHDGYSVRLQLGALALRRKRLDDALKHFSKATTIYPQGREAWASLARIWDAKKRSDRVADSLETLTLLDQNDRDAALRLMRLRRAQNRWKDVEEAARRALHIDPFQARAHALLGESLARRALLDRAILHLDLSLELAQSWTPRERSSVLLLLARTHLQNGDTPAALRAATLARQIAPSHPALDSVEEALSLPR